MHSSCLRFFIQLSKLVLQSVGLLLQKYSLQVQATSCSNNIVLCMCKQTFPPSHKTIQLLSIQNRSLVWTDISGDGAYLVFNFQREDKSQSFPLSLVAELTLSFNY